MAQVQTSISKPRRHPSHVLGLAIAAVLAPAGAARALPAFPGAEGFGANATGGRGGDVYHVTTLADDPNHLIPGSLYYGLYEKNVPAAGRTIVFDVGGTINLTGGTLDIKNISKVTIAGQTAPSPVTIIGDNVQITGSSGKTTSNIVMRYLTLRKGTGNGEDALSIKGAGTTTDIIVDHVSGSWSEDEVISVTQNATRVTVQNSMLSEALTSSHAYGSLIRPQINSQVSYIRNLYSNQKSRNPRPGTYDNMTLDFEFRNNVIYNWSDRAGYSGGSSEGDTEKVNLNYVGNYLVAGPSTVGGPTTAGGTPTVGARRNTAFTRDASNSPIELKVYQDGNKIDWSAGATRDGVDIGWTMFANWSGSSSSAFPLADRMASPFATGPGTIDSADDAYAKVISSVGAFPYARSAVDQRLINDVVNYTGTAPITAPQAAEWNAILNAPTVTRPADWDTDKDGMPNWWETARGLNPAAADNNGVGPNGYTHLENYLNYLTYIANWNRNADGNWSAYLNWAGDRPTGTDSTANFGPGITAPRTVTLDIPASVGQLNLDGTQGYTLAGPSRLTIDVVSGTASIGVVSGNHTISAPLLLSDDTNVTVNTGASLTATNLEASPTAALRKAGAGKLSANAVNVKALNIDGGTLQLTGTGQSTTNALSVAAGATLDLGGASLAVNFTGASPLSGILDKIRAAYDNGRWDLPGITSALAASTPGSGIGVKQSAGQVLLKYTYVGDANLDGLVNAADASLMNPAGTTWDAGDFNYDGRVTPDDYALFALGAAASAGQSIPVPEPTPLLVPLLVAGTTRLRRR